ncbi:conserved hypothetical protein [Gloeothece citriformis PCC 7424]|uniref:Conjugation TrbI family protein n=1 Tax=Gloeothece citriformis (strain PCC 7424) TaxID=65393 RepID=B7KCN2_GLOC7|nr:TrbI/VirB10 family protein [Gloeothece citriformis]ACK71583.1 conserved hypothetical protein [Gloeothece citriformis PCC 7424]
MTRYLNPSDIIPEILLPEEDEQPVLNGQERMTLKAFNDSESEGQPVDWESQMSKLVGLEEDISLEDNHPQDNSLSSPLEPESETSNPKPSLSSNPFMKLGLVGGATLVIFILAGGFLLQIMNLGNQKPTQKNPIQPQQPLKTESRLEKLETEVETLKTKLAFAEQEQAIKNAQQTLRIKKSSPMPTVSPAIAPSNSPAPPAPQIQTVYVPRIVTVERVVKVPQPSQPVAKATPQPPVAQSTPTSTPTPQPMSSPTPKPTPTPQQVNPSVGAEVFSPVEDPETVVTSATSQPPLPPVSIANPPQASPQTREPVAVGTSTEGILATAVFGETSTSRNSEQEKNVFVVTLQKPLKNRNGEVVLPENAQLLSEINSLSDRGLLYLTVTKAIWEKGDNLIEKTLPKGALGVRAPEGKPLFAQKYPNESGSITSMDMNLFFLGGLGKVAQLFNRTDSEVVTTNIGGTIVTNNNRDPNYAAGVLEGGINSIVPQITQRNQQRIAEKLQRTNIWFIPAGTSVEVYVNQPLKF